MSARIHPVRLVAIALGLTLIVLGPQSSAQAIGRVHAPVVGSGSTWSANALQQWIRNVFANYQWTITYSESGSTQGRNDFANGTANFGVSEIPYGIANSNEADVPPPRGFAYMPIVAGGTAFMYNLEIGGRRVTNLRLSGDTLARIFTGEITVWNDPAIATDNPSLALPATPIVPVVRSDGSGTSAQFSTWLRQEHTATWDAYCGRVGRPFVNGHCGVTSNYPTVPGSAFVAKSGANGVAGYVAQQHAVGSITFVEYSYALNARFPVVKLLNDAGFYTEPTASNVAVALLQARINEDQGSQNYLTQDLTNVYTNTDPRTYPLSSYSYIILPTRLEYSFTEDKGLTLADFGAYFLCEGQQQAETLGYSPLPVNLVLGAQRQIQKVPGGDPASTGFSVAQCNNPTLDPNDPSGNALANRAPMPQDCDRFGVPQCATGTGGARDTPTAASQGGGGGAAGAESSGGGAADAAGPGGSGPGAAGDAEVLAAGGGAAVSLVAGTPQQLSAAQPGMPVALALAGAGAGILVAAAVPPLLGRRRRRSSSLTPTRGSPA
jgi:phosphate ABC transporter phosphate-binding protein